MNKLSQVSRKNVIGSLIIALFSVLIFILPPLLGKEIQLILSFSTLVMLSIYVVLSFEIIHRTAIAILGAAILVSLVIAFQLVVPHESLDFIIGLIDFNTIGLLFGMMIIVAILGETGIFNWVAIKATELSKGNPWRLMVILCTFTAIVSAFVDNVTVILLMVPVTLTIFRFLKRSPFPYVIGQTMCSNIGGAATLIGDPPNIIIGSAANIDFNSFVVGMGPTIAITFAISLFILRLFFSKELKENFDVKVIKKFRDEEEHLIRDKNLLKKCLIILTIVIFFFTIQGIIGIEVSLIAFAGAAVLLVISKVSVEKVLHEVDWSTLLFFTGLFIVIGIFSEYGGIKILSTTVIGITGGDPWSTFISIVWLSAIASGFVDNIPFTVTMTPLLESLTKNTQIITGFGHLPINPLWWALALGADLGGNLTLIGSSAGVVAAGISAKYGFRITFNQWFKIGLPFTISTVFIGMVILAIFTLLS
ncbi:MAG TPA: ArsB/NhaD family transporter [Nitrososphaeraceae archaeon]|nr:ArsB/NhaD family transporter [Nitrososphaeraceae archaeon]